MQPPVTRDMTSVRAPLGPSSELDVLVARTAGLQPWRKAFHAFNAVALAIAIATFDPPPYVLLTALGAIVVLLVLADLVRLRNDQANQLFFRAFAALASPREARSIASSTWYAIGLFVAFALFPRDVALSCVLVMGLGDPVASYLGRRFGKRPFLGGTLEGTFAFVLVAALVLLARHPAPAALIAAMVSAFAERRSWPLDDNLAVPVACGAALLGTQWLLG
jgi:dolichol kinase